jgi:hypothetical protein
MDGETPPDPPPREESPLETRGDLVLARMALKWDPPDSMRQKAQALAERFLESTDDRAARTGLSYVTAAAKVAQTYVRMSVDESRHQGPTQLVDARTAISTPVDQLTPELWPLRTLLDACRDDPARFQAEVLGRQLWSKQIEACQAIVESPVTLVPAGRAVGKSYLLAGVVLWWLYTRPGSLVITTGPDHRQVVSVLWKEIRRALSDARMRLGSDHLSEGYVSPQRLTLQAGRDWGALGFATKGKEGLSGQHAAELLVIVDEASGVLSDSWDAIHGLAASKLVIAGNPIRYDCHFRELHDLAVKGSTTIKSVAISSLEAPDAQNEFSPVGMASRSFLNQMREIHGEESPWWWSNILGRFPGAEAVQFLPRAWIDACTPTVWRAMPKPIVLDTFHGTQPPCEDINDLWHDYPAGSAWIGVDVGGGVGADRSAVVVRNSKQVLAIFASEWHGVLDDARHRLEPVVIELARKWGVAPDRVIYDKAGVGRSFGSYLAARGFEGAVGYFGAGKGGKLYVNRRTANAFALKRRLDPHRENHVPLYCGGLPEWPALRQELAELRSPVMEIEEGQVKQRLEDKEEMQGRLHRSPDLLDALLMTFTYSE